MHGLGRTQPWPLSRRRPLLLPSAGALFASKVGCLYLEDREPRKKASDGADALALLERSIIAVLATYRADGTVLLSPVWHEWRDGAFHLVLGADDVKARHLRRDPRASIVVAESAPPYAGVEARGSVTFLGRGDVLDRRLAIRYLGEQLGNAYADAGDGASVEVRLVPDHLRSWDFADDFPST